MKIWITAITKIYKCTVKKINGSYNNARIITARIITARIITPVAGQDGIS